MEKKYSMKELQALYYDNKLLPVVTELKKGKTYLHFVLSGAKLEVIKNIYNTTTYNNGAQGVLMLQISNDTTRYAEIGTVTSAINCYGGRLIKDFPQLARIKQVIDNKLVSEDRKTEIIAEFFNTELSVEEIKTLFKDLNTVYKLKPSKEK